MSTLVALTRQKERENSMAIETSDFDHNTDEYRQPQGRAARLIEKQAAKLSSDFFLWASAASIGGSLVLQMLGKKQRSLFVGQWAPTLLLFGIYNKFVREARADRTEHFEHVEH